LFNFMSIISKLASSLTFNFAEATSALSNSSIVLKLASKKL